MAPDSKYFRNFSPCRTVAKLTVSMRIPSIRNRKDARQHPLLESRKSKSALHPSQALRSRDISVATHADAASLRRSSSFIISRITNFWIFPVTVIGKLSTNRMYRGIL